jgi:hypothetical protein
MPSNFHGSRSPMAPPPTSGSRSPMAPPPTSDAATTRGNPPTKLQHMRASQIYQQMRQQ